MIGWILFMLLAVIGVSVLVLIAYLGVLFSEYINFWLTEHGKHTKGDK